jgi:hypothetical protein
MSEQASAERQGRQSKVAGRRVLLAGLGPPEGTAAVLHFIRELDASLAARELNRGYLLARYGDLPGDGADPVSDSPPYPDWTHTRSGLQQRLIGQPPPGAEDVALYAVDLYSLFDFCIARHEPIRGATAVTLASAADWLWSSASLPAEIATRLLALASVALDPAGE